MYKRQPYRSIVSGPASCISGGHDKKGAAYSCPRLVVMRSDLAPVHSAGYVRLCCSGLESKCACADTLMVKACAFALSLVFCVIIKQSCIDQALDRFSSAGSRNGDLYIPCQSSVCPEGLCSGAAAFVTAGSVPGPDVYKRQTPFLLKKHRGIQ